MPFNVDDYVNVDADTELVDFPDLSFDELSALVEAYGRLYPALASAAVHELWSRAYRDVGIQERAVRIIHGIVRANRVDGDVFADALHYLYSLDRQRGQAEVVRVIATCPSYAVQRVAEALRFDIELYRGDTAFDDAVLKTAQRLIDDCQKGHVLSDDEVWFLRNAGHSV
ncbi:MAG: hypothetical protein QM756_08060 [Polyangiaceae bacterium]